MPALNLLVILNMGTMLKISSKSMTYCKVLLYIS